jgi:two-component system sensor histidine kinase KdpD
VSHPANGDGRKAAGPGRIGEVELEPDRPTPVGRPDEAGRPTPVGHPGEPGRPTGDEMLARLKAEEHQLRGRLRLYLGMAPGVGKTYTMLEEAHRRHDRGTDVVVGFVETYGRVHTIALLEGLETVPRLRMEYRGVVIEEMDADAIIARNPTVALIDELAHTNVPGSPREKRWQDVEAIRDAGIDVISTCNVQHIESVADAVQTILGLPVRERIPEEVVRSADEIELVDMSPHALRQRMRHGNVYPPERTTIALNRFFTEPNLMALRDLSLRFVAGRVDEELEVSVASQGIGLPPVAERVMAVVDETPDCRRALRRAASLASALHAPWIALAVFTPGVAQSRDRQQDLNSNVDYAIDLGGEVVRREAGDPFRGLVETIAEHRISHLVLVPERRRGLSLGRRSLAERLLDAEPGLEIHLLGESAHAH